MAYRYILYLLIGLSLLSLILLVIIVIYSKKSNKHQSIKVRNKQSYFLNDAYKIFIKIPLVKNYLQKVRKRIEILEVTDLFTINKKTMAFAIRSIGVSLLLFIVLFTLDQDLDYLLIVGLTIIIIHNQVLKVLIDYLEEKLLLQFEHFLGDIRHHYNEHGMIDESIYDSIEDCEYEMSLHASNMYDILQAKDVEEEMNHYYDRVPNKFIKTFLALVYMVQKFGDREIDGTSAFLTNLNYLKQEISLERLKRQKLNYLFRSLSVISVIPIFLIKPLEKWAMNGIPDLKNYYEGAYGFTIQVLLFLIVLLAYQLINRLRQAKEEVTYRAHPLEEWLMKSKFFKKIGIIIEKKNYTSTLKVQKLLKLTGAKISSKQFLIRKCIYGLLGFLLSLVVIINIHIITKDNILTLSYEVAIANKEINEETALEIQNLDNQYIKEFTGKSQTEDMIKEYLIEREDIRDNELAAIAAKRIMDKLLVYNNQYFKWWELIICILIGTLFYYIPYLLLVFRERLVEMNREDEVLQFHTIILMLIHSEYVSVEDILQWMEVFSDIFKDSLIKCLNNLEVGDFEALEQLKIDEPYQPFVRLVEDLQAAADKITIESAFDELKVERSYYKDKRKQDTEINVNQKGIWGKTISFLPVGSVILFYLLVPFTHLSITQFINYTSQISGVI